MFAYTTYILKWFVDTMNDFGGWLSSIPSKVTHDPIWAGGALGVVVLICVLAAIKAQASRR